MIYLILLSHLISVIFLVKIAIFYKKSPLWALLYLLIPGFHLSLYFACPESIAASFLVVGLYFYLKEKLALGSLFLALSILTRETAVLLVVILIFYEVFKKKGLKNALIIGSSLIPYALWRLFLLIRLFGDYGWKTLFFTPKNFTLPFLGLSDLYQEVLKGNYPEGLVSAALSYPVLLILIFFTSIYLLFKRKDLFSLLLFFYSLLSVSLNYTSIWVHTANGERGTFEAFLFFILLIISIREKKPMLHKILLICFILLMFIFNYFWLEVHGEFRAGLFFLR